MPWLIDGSNVLGAMRVDRHSDEPKRNLVRLLASFARARRTRVTCIFDGPEPASFAKGLGAVTVVFSGARTADDLIVERTGHGRGWSVVTADRALAARIRGRHVGVVAPATFLREIETAAGGESETDNDWLAWFSDPENRTKF